MAHPPNQKHLFELLQDDQEPFLLKDYIADRRSQIIRTTVQAKHQCYSSSSSSSLQPPGAVKKRRPISRNLARGACFLSFATDSPVSGDPRKSPLCFPKSPVVGSPAAAAVRRSKTASLLLEAALRISQKQQQQKSAKARNGGIFGSLLRRLTQGRRKGGKIDGGESGKLSLKDVLRWDFKDSDSPLAGAGRKSLKSRSRSPSSPSLRNGRTGSGGCETAAPGSTGPNSAIWSESTNADLDLDGCSSAGRSSCCLSVEEMEFVSEIMEFASGDNKQFCESPFHFVLQTSPSSSGHRTPEFSSPAASPIRLKAEESENNSDEESLKKCQVLKQQDGNEEEEEEEKEQCSPVSVLDPPFDDDDEDDDDDNRDDDQPRDDDFDMECSFAFVQRAKHQLLQKLRRFERLAELDPIELEKLMLEHDDQDDEEEDEEEEMEDGEEDEKSQFAIDELSSVPRDMKRLVSDLIDEEEEQGSTRTNNNNVSNASEEAASKRVCKRFESWKEVESNTIEMMVEQDFVGSEGEWRGNRDEVSDAAVEIEAAIFGLLAEELAEELLLLTHGGGPLMI